MFQVNKTILHQQFFVAFYACLLNILYMCIEVELPLEKYLAIVKFPGFSS